MYKCEFCGQRLDENDKVCKHCGGPVNNPIYVEDKIKTKNKEKTKQDNKIDSKKKKIIIAIIALLVMIPIICCCVCVVPEAIENIGTSDEDLKLKSTIELEINEMKVTIPMNVGEFLEKTKIEAEFPETYIINSNKNESITSLDYGYTLYVYNTTDSAKDYKDCTLGGIRISLDSAIIDAFKYGNITLNSSYKDATDYLGLPNYKYGSSKDRSATWYSNYGWIAFDWKNDKIDEITIEHYGSLTK